MKKFYLETYGCTANQNNSEIIIGILTKAGYKLTKNPKLANVIIVNTCIVKLKTEDKIRFRLKEIQKKYPKKKLVLAGCMPEANYKLCKELAPNASLVNTFHVSEITKAINKKIDLCGKRKEHKVNLPKINLKKDTTNIQIAEGCLSFCNYCQVKSAKGKLCSVPIKDIIKEIKSTKTKRINLTATDCGCYGLDIKTNLPNLLNEIIKLKQDFQIRIGMMNPQYTYLNLNKLIKIYKDPRIIKFLHIPVESGSDKVLKEMNRNYNINQFKKIVKKFRKEIPKINIVTDIIIGYPTETKKDFQKTLDLIKQTKPEVVNSSKFTPRPKTKAKKLKQLSSQEIKTRSILLNNLINKIRKKN